ncbi:MAG TPA: hypothetical protein VNW97_02770 [Candidatus Saccharimonadales bacterium]|jgi:hypothetical protein|nr:hypothetical protein [Candidatus Saccharimonadales bacterium]
MTNSRKTNLRFDASSPAMTIWRSRYWRRRIVYVLRADKSIKYKNGRSRIIYIGETVRGTKRPASSAAAKAWEAFGKGRGLKIRGLKKIDVHPVTFQGKQSVKLWKVLERDLLAVFKEKHGEPPHYNFHGKGFSVDDIAYFRKKRLLSVISQLS